MINIKEVFANPATGASELKRALYLISKLDKMPVTYKVDLYGNIMITKGKAKTYPTFCAHMDTVHSYSNGFNLCENTIKGELFAVDNNNKSVGVGGDDACGIYVCLRLLEELPEVKIVFFSQEESGGIGSHNIDTSFFKDSRFLGGIDRKGATDFASKYAGDYRVSTLFLNTLQPVLLKYNRTEVVGGGTDAFYVDLDISCFNMSCGYYNPHTNNEYVVISEVEDTLNFCIDIAKTCTKIYPFEKPKNTFKNHYSDRTSAYYPNIFAKDVSDDYHIYETIDDRVDLSVDVFYDQELENNYGWISSKEEYLKYKKYLQEWEQLEVIDYLERKGIITLSDALILEDKVYESTQEEGIYD